ncbi:hypothetical protein RSAG8_12169, partial [Rhizoctonia solani AG-8 WAC10335]
MKDGRNRIRNLFNEAKEFYQWSPPPRPKSERSAKRRRLADGLGNLSPTREVDSMSIDSCEDAESESEELESLNEAGPMRRIRGEVGSYTLRNYAYGSTNRLPGTAD